MERRRSSRLARQAEAAPYNSNKGNRDNGSTGLTSYMAENKLDWEEPTRSFSLFGGKKKDKEKKVELPPNWKKAKDKEGSIYYFNTVTQQKTHEVPPPLPKGWREALHKDSGRVYYYHKETRQSTFQFPTADQADEGADDDTMSEAEPPPAPEGFFGRTFSKFSGAKKSTDSGLARSGTMQRTGTMSRGGKKKEEAAKKGGATTAGGKEGGDGQKTVFISCSTLIREVKLCVGSEQHAALDSLYEKLTSHEIPAEQAVRVLMEMVGSTVVQQAGLSVMNAQKGVLPHGWLEYTDEASGRPYYYNVHTKVTTWYKPTGAVPPPPPPKGEEEAGGDVVNFDVTFATHNVAMSGFI